MKLCPQTSCVNGHAHYYFIHFLSLAEKSRLRNEAKLLFSYPFPCVAYSLIGRCNAMAQDAWKREIVPML